jgi:hypothetical protein
MKRKRDSAPVDSLYLEADAGKRRRTQGNFVFKRVEHPILPLPHHIHAQNRNGHAVDNQGIPIVHATESGDEVRDPFALRRDKNQPSHHIVVETDMASEAEAHSDDDTRRKFELARDPFPDLMEIDAATTRGYVYDSFVREPLNEEQVPSGVGARLVIGQGDREWMENYFYSEDEDDDVDRIDTDDEDSNAEDYVGADYPDDEDEDYNHSSDEDDR